MPDAGLPTLQDARLSALSVRPELFQARDTSRGQSFDGRTCPADRSQLEPGTV